MQELCKKKGRPGLELEAGFLGGEGDNLMGASSMEMKRIRLELPMSRLDQAHDNQLHLESCNTTTVEGRVPKST
jgi:hypothetical protein